MLVLNNVQSDVTVIRDAHPDTLAMCRRCPDHSLPGQFNLTLCSPCGELVDLSAAARRLSSVWIFDAEERKGDVAMTLPGAPLSATQTATVDPLLDTEEELGYVSDWLKLGGGWSELSATRRTTRPVPMILDIETPVVGGAALPGHFKPLAAARASTPNSSKLFAVPRRLAGDENHTASPTGALAENTLPACAPDVTSDPPVPWAVGDACYKAVDLWKGDLICPRGTQSPLGATKPDDCKQLGLLVAVVDIFKCFPPRTWCMQLDVPQDYQCKEEDALCDNNGDLTELFPLDRYRSDPTWKSQQSYLYGQPMESGQIVEFLGIDPLWDYERYMQKPFFNITVKPMQACYLMFDFSHLNEFTRLNSGNQGHFNIHIHSNLLADRPDELEKGHEHSMPMFFQRATNSHLNFPFTIRLLSLSEELTHFSVFIDLRHGGHLDYMHTINQSLDIKRYSPKKSMVDTNNFFVAVIYRDFLLDGSYELPYNMPPGEANSPGEPEFILDAINVSGRYNAPRNEQNDGDKDGLIAILNAGTAYWSATPRETVGMPWVPFLSNCDGFDSHIIIWELFENPHNIQRDGCKLLAVKDQVLVRALLIDPTTFQFYFNPVLDMCQIVTMCRFEESLQEADYASTPWWRIDDDLDLFYITRQPVSFEQYKEGNAFFSTLLGTNQLVKVGLSGGGSKGSGAYPRRVIFEIFYDQRDFLSKKIVTAKIILEGFDSVATDEYYWLMLHFEAVSWDTLMNKFQLGEEVYTAIFMFIGLSCVGFAIAALIFLRLITHAARTPPFRLKECYEFLLWWPLQGVIVASAPVMVLCLLVKLLFSVDPTSSWACTFAAFEMGKSVSAAELGRCKRGRTGTSFLIGGALIMWNASKLLLPRLREIEEQFLMQQPTAMLSREGLPLSASQRSAVRQLPIRWKRLHLIFVSIMLVMPLMAFWEFTYSGYFADNAILFIIGFGYIMSWVDGALSKAVREELLALPLSTAASVVLFIGTLGSADFQDFAFGFFIELVYGIVDRVILVFVYRWVAEARVATIKWMKSRAWLWSIVLILPGSSKIESMLEMAEEDADGEEDAEEEVEGTPIEEALEELLGCADTCMSTVISPLLILVIWMFNMETQIGSKYEIELNDYGKYMLFGVVMAPFQVMMDILMNYGTEIKHGVRIYDAMLYAQYRWRNRLNQWLFDDPRMDESVAEPLQSVNHLCFSPQFYFMEAYYTWGMLLIMIAVTIMLRATYNPFDDPTFIYFVVQQAVCQTIMTKVTRLLIFDVLWQPKRNSIYRTFRHTVTVSIRRKAERVEQESHRHWFLDRHAGWISQHLHEVFTPRSMERYRTKLAELYQRALALEPETTFVVAGPALPSATGFDELPKKLQEELGESDSESDPEVEPVALMSGDKGMASIRASLFRPSNQFGRSGTSMRQSRFAIAPPEPPAPPALEWPLVGPTADQPSVGHGPLAALACRAWLYTVRRRRLMKQLAEEYRAELPPKLICARCNASESSPFVQAGVGVWKSGVGLQLVAARDMMEIIQEFEVHRDVPPMELDAEQWFAWLERASPEPWETLCIRCRKANGPKALGDAGRSAAIGAATSLPALAPPAGNMALPPVPPAGAAKGVAPRLPALAPPGGGAALPLLQPERLPLSDDYSEEEDSKYEDEDEDDEELPALPNVEVSLASREIILSWARQAAKRVKARSAMVLAQRQEEMLEQASSDDESAGSEEQCEGSEASSGRG